MKVTYSTSREEQVKLERLRFKYEQDLIALKWILRIFSFIIFQCIIATVILLIMVDSFRYIPIATIYLISNLFFIALWPYCSRKCSRALIMARLKNVNFEAERSLDVREDMIVWKACNYSVNYQWSFFKSIERFPEYILLKYDIGSNILPIDTFESQQEAEEFVELTKSYKKQSVAVNNIDSLTGNKSKFKAKPFPSKAWKLIIAGVAFIFLFNSWLTSGGKYSFWSHVFNEGDPHQLYMETTEGFQCRVTEEQWERLVSQWREKLGTWKKTKIKSFVPYSCDEYPDKLTKSHGRLMDVWKMEFKVIGNKGVAHITSYNYEVNGSRLISSFEIVFKATDRQSFLLEEDVRFVEEND